MEEVKKSNIVEEAKAELINILEIGLEDPLSQEIEKGRGEKMIEEETENEMTEGAHTHNMRDIRGLPANHNPQYATIVKTTIKPKPNRVLKFLNKKLKLRWNCQKDD